MLYEKVIEMGNVSFTERSLAFALECVDCCAVAFVNQFLV